MTDILTDFRMFRFLHQTTCDLYVAGHMSQNEFVTRCAFMRFTEAEINAELEHLENLKRLIESNVEEQLQEKLNTEFDTELERKLS